MRLILIDNYDSFTWNLVSYLRELGVGVEVFANDALDAERVLERAPEALVLSPGPGRPENAGICVELVRRASGRVPLLGVCLGHQAIALAHGGRVVYAGRLVHGKTSLVEHDGRGLYRGLPRPLQAMRYHSLAVDASTLPGTLLMTARTQGGELMGLRHRYEPTWGVQFHPESVLTPAGKPLLANFLALARRWGRRAPRAA